MMRIFQFMTDLYKGLTPWQMALALFVGLILLISCGSKTSTNATRAHASARATDLPYQLEQPNTIITITEPDLKEISGLSPTDQTNVFCALADEKGELFFVDIDEGGKIVRRIPFIDSGDFEGVEMVDHTLWAVTSKGKLFKITAWDREGQAPTVTSFDLGLTKENDVEGLCYHPAKKILLIACKEDPEQDIPRQIWGFDPVKGLLIQPAIYTIDPIAVDRLVPHDSDDKKRFFSTSGIAIHPWTSELYVISSALKRLIVLDEAGQLKTAVRLSKKILPQPEGIAFDTKGNLIISSEGKNDDQGQILIFETNSK
jgi:uncharacterized protein YjiK